MKVFELLSHQSGLTYFNEGVIDVNLFKPGVNENGISNFLANQKIKIDLEKGKSAYC